MLKDDKSMAQQEEGLSECNGYLKENIKFSRVNTKQLVSIEYPGFVKSVPRLLETIGGEKNLSQTYFRGKTRLQMTYRPEDLHAHCVYGDLVPCTGVLMKVKKRKRMINNKEVYEYNQEILGVIKNQYKFQTLMDFQYLAPEPLWNYFNEIHGSELGQQKFPPYFAPPVFGRIDSCGSYNYRPNPLPTRQLVATVSKEMKETFQNYSKEAASVARKRRQTESMAALFDIQGVPERPSENAVRIINKLTGGPESEAIETVRKLFEERPIWSKLAISCHLNTSLDRLKRILQYFAYYWLSGPWRTMWCRMGYDPRNDRSAKIYQMIDFRIRESKEPHKNYISLIPKRSYKDYIPRNLQSRSGSFGSSVLASTEQPSDKEKHTHEPYIFHPNKMLPSRNMMYQLCDIYDEGIQETLNASENQASECNEKEGWFVPGTMNKIRKQMGDVVKIYFEKNKKNTKDSKNTGKKNQADEKDNPNLDEENVSETINNETNLEQFHETNKDFSDSENLNLPGYSGEGINIAVSDDNVSYMQMLEKEEYFEEFPLDLEEDNDDEYDDLYYEY